MIENENKKVKESMTIHVGKIVKQLAENLKKING